MVELIEEDDESQTWWISEKPKKNNIGLVAYIDFRANSIFLREENQYGKVYNHVFIGIPELDELYKIVEEKLK